MTLKQAERLAITGIFFGALLLRLFALFYLPARPITDDAFEYNYIAQNIGQALVNQPLEDKNRFLYFGAKRGWLYPLFIAGVYKLCGTHDFFVRLAQVIIDSITCLLIYCIGKDIFNRKAGVVAALIAAFYPGFIYYSTMFYQETTTMFLLTLFVLIFTKAVSQKKQLLFLIAGALTVILSFYRSGFLFFTIFVTIALCPLFINYYKRGFSGHCLSFFAGVGATAILYGLFSYTLCGAFIFNKPSIAWSFYETIHRDGWISDTFAPTPSRELFEVLQHDPQATTAEGQLLKLPPAVYAKAGILHIQKQPVQFFSQLIKRLQRMWAYIETYPGKWHSATVYAQLIAHRSLIILALIGIPLSLFARHQSQLLCIIILYVIGAYIPIIGIPRYALPAVPFVIIFAAYALMFIISLQGSRKNWLVMKKISISVIAASVLIAISNYLDVATLLPFIPHSSPRLCYTIHFILVNLSFITSAYCLYQILTLSGLKQYHRFAVSVFPLLTIIIFYTNNFLTGTTWHEWQCPLETTHQRIKQTIILPDDFSPHDYSTATLLIDMFGGGGNSYDFNVLLNEALVKKYDGGLKVPEGKFDNKFFGLYKSFLFDGYKLKPEDLRQWYEIDLPLTALDQRSFLTIECFLGGKGDGKENFVLVFGDYTTVEKKFYAGPCFPESDADTSMVKIMPYDGDYRFERVTPLYSLETISEYHNGREWLSHDLSDIRGRQSGSYRIRVELISKDGKQVIL